MIKRIILYALTVLIISAGSLYAEDYVGVGAHFGLHNDVGNLDSFDPSIMLDPQNSCMLGFSFKTNLLFFFSRFGVDTTFIMNKGDVLEGSSEIDHSKIYYVSLPFFIGYNYKLLDVGNFYMGPGLSYFIARGRVTSSAAGLSEDINAYGWGFGFIAGMEFRLSSNVDFYFEWEYLNGRSKPVLQSQSGYAWDDFYIDFTGHRFLFGVRYYLVQF